MKTLTHSHFQEITEVKADSKNRIALGNKVRHPAKYYRVYQDEDSDTILLEPLAFVPFSEPWLNKNRKAKESLERGLRQAKAGQLTRSKEDFSKYI